MSETRKLAAKKAARDKAAGGSGWLLAACRLAGVSALKARYADLNALTQFGPMQGSITA